MHIDSGMDPMPHQVALDRIVAEASRARDRLVSGVRSHQRSQIGSESVAALRDEYQRMLGLRDAWVAVLGFMPAAFHEQPIAMHCEEARAALATL